MSSEVLQQLVYKAQKNCASFVVTEIRLQLLTGVMNEFLTGKIDLATYNKNLRQIPFDGKVVVFCQDDLRRLLRLVEWPLVQIPDTMVHEIAHHDKAVKYGLKPHFGVQLSFLRNPIRYVPHVAYAQVDLPNELEDNFARRIMKEIISAPKYLSDYDKLSLPSTQI